MRSHSLKHASLPALIFSAAVAAACGTGGSGRSAAESVLAGPEPVAGSVRPVSSAQETSQTPVPADSAATLLPTPTHSNPPAAEFSLDGVTGASSSVPEVGSQVTEAAVPVSEVRLPDTFVKCSTYNPAGLIYVKDSRVVWQADLSAGLEDYLARVSNREPNAVRASFFRCRFVALDTGYNVLLAYSTYSHGDNVVSKLSFVDVLTGDEVQHLWHPGSITGIMPYYGFPTFEGTLDFMLMSAMSEMNELTQGARRFSGRRGPLLPVPVISVVDRRSLTVLTYAVVGTGGQVFNPMIVSSDGEPFVSFFIQDSEGSVLPHELPFKRIFSPGAIQLAERYTDFFR